MDIDGYPTYEELDEVRTWDPSDLDGLMEDMESGRLWHFEEYIKKRDGIWHVSTGGWSGNEDVIGELKRNKVFWLMNFYSERRGGHYTFRSCLALT